MPPQPKSQIISQVFYTTLLLGSRKNISSFHLFGPNFVTDLLFMLWLTTLPLVIFLHSTFAFENSPFMKPFSNYPNLSVSSISLRVVTDTDEKNQNSPFLLLNNVSQISQGSRALTRRGQIPRIPSTVAQQYSILTPYFLQPCLKFNNSVSFPHDSVSQYDN